MQQYDIQFSDTSQAVTAAVAEDASRIVCQRLGI